MTTDTLTLTDNYTNGNYAFSLTWTQRDVVTLTAHSGHTFYEISSDDTEGVEQYEANLYHIIPATYEDPEDLRFIVSRTFSTLDEARSWCLYKEVIEVASELAAEVCGER